MIIKNRNQRNDLYRKIYMLWYNIQRRCYNPKFPQYKNYGGKDVSVCERWRILDNFIEDVDKIDGFNLHEFIQGNLALDKDIKVKGNKIYSLQTCQFTSLEENNKVKINQQKPFKAISPSGEVYEHYNQSEFAREHGLNTTNICACLNGRLKSHYGWTFTYWKVERLDGLLLERE